MTVALACTEDDGCPIYYNLFRGGTLVILGTPAVLGRRRHGEYRRFPVYSHAKRRRIRVHLPARVEHEACSEQSRTASRFVCYSFRLNAAAASRANERIIPLLRRRSPTLP